MNRKKVIAAAFAVLGLVAVVALVSNECRALVACIGKGVWYIPYASFVASAKLFAC